MSNTQLTSATNYDTSRMVFSDPVSGTVPNMGINYKRIPITTVYEDGSTGPLIFPTELCFSLGVQEDINRETGELRGYKLPLSLYTRDNPTPAEKEWVETFNAAVEQCKAHAVEVRREIGKAKLELYHLENLNPLWYKQAKDASGNPTGEKEEGATPWLYAKLITSKKQNHKIITKFYKADSGEEMDPLTLTGKHYCTARAAIKFDSIFIGKDISLQIRVYECDVTPQESGMPRLLSRPKANTRVLQQSPSINSTPLNEEDDDEDDGSIPDDSPQDLSEEEPTPQPVKKRVVRKVVRKKAA